MLATRKLFSRRAISRSRSWPLCSAPIVGTRPMPLLPPRRARSSETPEITSGIRELPGMHLTCEGSDGVGKSSGEIGVLPGKRRLRSTAQAQDVVCHQHLAIAIRSGADADHRDAQ